MMHKGGQRYGAGFINGAKSKYGEVYNAYAEWHEGPCVQWMMTRSNENLRQSR